LKPSKHQFYMSSLAAPVLRHEAEGHSVANSSYGKSLAPGPLPSRPVECECPKTKKQIYKNRRRFLEEEEKKRGRGREAKFIR
jgi:hypothetical protein